MDVRLTGFRQRPRFDWHVLPVQHLGVPETFYEHPGRAASFIPLRQPAHVLLRYGDFVYRVALKAVAVRASFGHDARHCDAQARETYDHLLERCPYVRAIWCCFAPMRGILQMQLPSSVAGFLYDDVAAPYSPHELFVRALWPILRACVWYCLWLERNNRVFRTTLTQPPAAALAIQAATIARLHVRHFARRAVVPSLDASLAALRDDPWCVRYLVRRTMSNHDH